MTNASAPAEFLNQLHDIATPAPTGIWPLAPGYYLLAGLAVLFALCVAAVLYRRWQRRYQRLALNALQQAVERASPQDSATLYADLNRVLKRYLFTVSAPSRSYIASLSGERWYAYLLESATPAEKQKYEALTYCWAKESLGAAAQVDHLNDFIEFAQSWVRHTKIREERK